jgi:hypothetical protein
VFMFGRNEVVLKDLSKELNCKYSLCNVMAEIKRAINDAISLQDFIHNIEELGEKFRWFYWLGLLYWFNPKNVFK